MNIRLKTLVKLYDVFILYSFALLFVFGCSSKVNAPQSEQANQVEMSYTKACSKGSCPCSSPLGPIVDGGTALAYDTSQVTCGNTCQPHAITLKCKNGAFDKDIKALSFSCQVNACQACTVGNNQVPHGFTVQMYKGSTVSCGQSCDDNKRALVCKDGKLQGTLAGASADGKDSLYSATSCLPASCSCAIPDGGTMSLGGTMKFYKAANGTCSVPCENASNVTLKTCVQGGQVTAPTYAFSGDSTFTKSSCLERPPSLCGCVLPDDKKTLLAHGLSQDLYPNAAPVNCATCDSSKMTVYCDSGTLYNKPSSDSSRVVIGPSDLSSHKILSCDPGKTLDCSINNLCIADKTSKTLYGKNPLTCNDMPADSRSMFACNSTQLLRDGVTYDPLKDSFKTTWQVSSPSNSCVGCAMPWGGSVSVNSKVTMFKSSAGSSNSCGTGCKQFQFTCQASGQFSSGDTLIDADYKANTKLYTQTCQNSCSQEGGGAPPRFCLLPWQNSFVSADSVIPMWNKKVVEYGDSCQNHYKLGRCMLSTGTFDAGIQFIYKSCTELPFSGLRVDSITPKYLGTNGGAINLTGVGFASGMQINIGKQACTNINVVGSTSATCTAISNVVGSYDITAIVAGKKAILPSALSYYNGTCSAGPGFVAFKYTGANQSFVVPAGCNSINIQAWGAGGGGRQMYTTDTGVLIAQSGGAGGFSSGTMNVTSGNTLSIVVGGGGSGGYYQGSTGGGYSGVFSSSPVTSAGALVIAGGGGGAGDPTGCNKGGTAGEGGGSVGGTHGSCSGLGGTQSAGGAGGASANPGLALKGGNISTGQNGYAGQGMGSGYQSGGGGGGGYFGGGAGSEVMGLAGAGGGGSGYVIGSASNAKSLVGSGRLPPQTNNPNYQSGIGVGGTDSTNGYSSSAGGQGLIVISY